MAESKDIRWKQRFSNFKKAFMQLKSAVNLASHRELSDLEMQGLIKAFEFTFELSWNVMKDFLFFNGVQNIIGSRDAFRSALQNNLISRGDDWMQMITDRNIASHAYDESDAKNITNKIINVYASLFDEFAKNFESKL